MLEISDIPVEGYESVRRGVDSETGLHAIISLHSTALGPALGGMRLWNYASEEEALTDVLRLSRGMTYKAACAGLDLGGGKSVIVGDPAQKTEALFESMGEFVESYQGQYITAEDVNTKPEDMEAVARQTQHAVGLLGKSGNPSPYTAWGCFLGLRACMEQAFGSDDLQGKVVALEGAGSVGSRYAELIAERGGKLLIADIREDAAQSLAAKVDGIVLPVDQIRGADCDVFAPCALGGSLDDDTIADLKAKIVCGAANNQLAETRHGQSMRDRGILYGPDYVVNAGGLINVFNEFAVGGYNEDNALEAMNSIYDNLKVIFEISRTEGIPTADAADRFAERRIDAVRAPR